MTQCSTVPQAASAIAGFALAHAAWSVSDLGDNDLLCPLAVVEDPDGARRLLRFEAETQEEAIASGKSAMLAARSEAVAWAFAREGLLRAADGSHPEDVLSVDFWARGMTEPAVLVQPFERHTRRGQFRLLGAPWLVVDGQRAGTAVAASTVEAIIGGLMAHPKVAELWAGWCGRHRDV